MPKSRLGRTLVLPCELPVSNQSTTPSDGHRHLRPEAQPVGRWCLLTSHQQEGVRKLLDMMAAAAHALENSAEPENDIIPWLFEERRSQLAFINGHRGTGKTTLLTTLVRLIADSRYLCEGEGGSAAPGDVARQAQFLRERVILLEPLDMEPLPPFTPILAAILARLYQAVRRVEESSRKTGGLLATDWSERREMQKLQQYQARIASSLDSNLPQRKGSLDPEQFADAIMEQEHKRLELLPNLEKVLRELSAAILKERAGRDDASRKTGQLFLVPIDDVDLNPSRCLDLLRLLRSYSPPQFFFVLLGQYDMVEQIVKLKTTSEYNELKGHDWWTQNARSALRDKLAEIATANLRKMVPPGNLVELPPIGPNAIFSFRPLTGEREKPIETESLGALFGTVTLPVAPGSPQQFPRLDALLKCERATAEEPSPPAPPATEMAPTGAMSPPELEVADAANFSWDQYCALGAFQVSTRRLVDLWLELRRFGPSAAETGLQRGLDVVELLERHWDRIVDEDPFLSTEIRAWLKRDKLRACTIEPNSESFAEWDLTIDGAEIVVQNSPEGWAGTKRYWPRLRVAAASRGTGVPRLFVRPHGGAAESPPQERLSIERARTRCAYVLLHDVTMLSGPKTAQQSVWPVLSPVVPVQMVWRGDEGQSHTIDWPVPPLATFAEMSLFLKVIRTRWEGLLSGRTHTTVSSVGPPLVAELVRAWIAAGLDAIDAALPAGDRSAPSHTHAARTRAKRLFGGADEPTPGWSDIALRIVQLYKPAWRKPLFWRSTQLDEWLRRVFLLLMPEASTPEASRLMLEDVEALNVGEALKNLHRYNYGTLRRLRELRMKPLWDSGDIGLYHALNRSSKGSWLFVPVAAAEPPVQETISTVAREVRDLRSESLRSQLYALWTRGDREVETDLFTAFQTYHQAVELAKELATKRSHDPQVQRDLSLAYDKLGNVSRRLNRLEEAEEAYQNALAIDRERQNDVTDVHSRHDVCVSLNKLGDVFVRQNRLEMAIELFTEAFGIADHRAKANRKDDQAQRDLALALNNMGDVQLRLRQPRSAEISYRRAFAIRKDIAEANRNDGKAQLELANSHRRLGDVQALQKRVADAVTEYRKALSIAQQLAGTGSESHWPQIVVAEVSWKLGELVDDLSERQEFHRRAWTILKSERFEDIPFEPDIEEIYLRLKAQFEPNAANGGQEPAAKKKLAGGSKNSTKKSTGAKRKKTK